MTCCDEFTRSAGELSLPKLQAVFATPNSARSRQNRKWFSFKKLVRGPWRRA